MDGLNGQMIQKPKVFTYNVVFEHEAIQADILEHSGITRLLDMALDGFSCTVFCYGQTGSGKTHTLTGPPYLVRGMWRNRGKGRLVLGDALTDR